MNFTIYTLGDHSSLTAMLNGVAMLFNDPIFNEPGALGGSAVRLVFLVVLLGVVLAGMQSMWRNGQGSPTVLLTIFVLWMVLGFTKATVSVVDLYTGSSTTVDNVPLIVALPGGVFTDVGQVLGEKMQTAFSTVDASAPALSTTGFVNPLVYILSLRRVMASGMQPHIYNSLRYYAADCVLASDQVPSNIFNQYRTLKALLADDQYHDGYTVFFSNAFPNGTLASCEQVATDLQDNIGAWAGLPFSPPGNNMMTDGMGNNVLQGASEMGKSAVLSSGGGLGTIVAPTSTDASNTGQVLLDALGRTAAGAASDVAEISASLAFLPGFVDGLSCGSPSPGITMTDVNTCSLMSSDQDELARLTEAAKGGGFGRVMISFMGVFTAIWIGLAPLVMLVILAHGPRGPQIFGMYLLLGLWVVSWLPVAYMVNYYIDLSFRQAMAQLGGSGGNFNLNQIYSIYRVAADKISVASELMGAVPMLTFAVLSGSVYAMTKVAQTAPRPEGIDASAGHQTAAAHQQGLVATAAGYTQAGLGMELSRTGHAQATISKGKAAGQVVSSAQERVRSAEDSYNVAKQDALAEAVSSGRVDGRSNSFGVSVDQAYREATESGHVFVRDIGNSNVFHEGEAQKFEAAARAKYGRDTKGALFFSSGVDEVINNMEGVDVGRKAELSKAIKSSSAYRKTDASQKGAAGKISEDDLSKLEQGHALRHETNKSVTQAHREVNASRDALSYAESMSKTTASNQTFEPTQILEDLKTNSGMRGQLDPLVSAIRSDDRAAVGTYFYGSDAGNHKADVDRFMAEYKRNEGKMARGNNGNMQEVPWQRVIAMHAALDSGLAGRGDMLNVFGGELAGKPAIAVDTGRVVDTATAGVADDVTAASKMNEKEFDAWALKRHGGMRGFNYAALQARVQQVAQKFGIDPKAADNNSGLKELALKEADAKYAKEQAEHDKHGKVKLDPKKRDGVLQGAVALYDKTKGDLDAFGQQLREAHPAEWLAAEADGAVGTVYNGINVLKNLNSAAMPPKMAAPKTPPAAASPAAPGVDATPVSHIPGVPGTTMTEIKQAQGEK